MHAFGPWLTALLFTTAAGAVWYGGRNLAARADVIAERTSLGGLLAGALLLGVATSLPELGTTVGAASAGAGTLAGNNLLGGVAMQVAVLALIDATALRGRALTLFSPRAGLLLHGVFLALLLAIAAAAILGPDLALGGWVSPWSIALAATYGVTLYHLKRYEGDPRWEPRGEIAAPPESAVDMKDAVARRFAHVSLRRIGLQFVAFGVVVLVGGYVVATTGEAIAEFTGVGQTLVGATLVAGATSLPELSTTYSAVRLGAYSMAVGNILGTNALELALFLPADLAYTEGSIFDALDDASALLAVVGILVTMTYVWGVLERRDRTIAGAGVDSVLVLSAYLVGMILFGLAS